MSVTPDQRLQINRQIEGCVAAHRALEGSIADLTDEQAHGPSALPGWTIGHVLSHVARNAESFVRLLEAASAGVAGAQYPGGRDQRNGDIETGAVRSAADIVADVVHTNRALESSLASMTDSAWSTEVAFMVGAGPARDITWRRWREVAVHHVDLGLDATWRQWPAEYVRPELQRLTMLWASRRPMGLTTLPELAQRADDHQRLAWMLGRADIDGVEPAGLMA